MQGTSYNVVRSKMDEEQLMEGFCAENGSKAELLCTTIIITASCMYQVEHENARMNENKTRESPTQ